MFDASGRLLGHDVRGLRVWNDGTALSPPSLVVPMGQAAQQGPWGSQTLLASSVDGQTMVLARSSELSIWQASQPDRVRRVIAPPQTATEEPPGPPPTASPSRPATAESAGSESRTERRGRPGPPGRGGPPRQNILAIQLAPRSDRIYLLGDFGRLHIWTLEGVETEGPVKARRLELAEPLPDEFTSLALRPDGALLAIGDRAGNVTLFDTLQLKVVGKISPPTQESQGMLFALAFSPDGRRLAVGSPQGQVILWTITNPRSPRIAYRLPGQRAMVTGIVFDTKARRMATTTAGTEPMVEIWNLGLLEHELANLGLAD